MRSQVRAEDLTGNKALNASMITHASSEAVDSLDPDNMLSFDDEMADGNELKFLHNRTTDIKLSVQGPEDLDHLDLLLSLSWDCIINML